MNDATRVLLFSSGLALAAYSAYIMIAVVRKRRLGRESLSWPSVEGWMLTAEFIENDGEFLLKTRYRYEVDGREYVGRRHRLSAVGPSPLFSSLELPKLQERYQASNPCRVFYQPQNPAVAVLEPGPERSMGLIFGLIPFLWVCSGMLIGMSLTF
jgi:hypothetical protein